MKGVRRSVDTYIVPTYQKIAKRYAALYFHDTGDHPYINQFLKLLPNGSRILDAGCGNGNYTQYILRSGYRCEGIDLSPAMLSIARDRVPGVKFTLMDMRRLDYSSQSFDGILAAYSLIHIPSAQLHETLSEFYRVLKDDGAILIIVQKGLSDRIRNEPLARGQKIFMNFFSVRRLTDYLIEAGFTVFNHTEKQIFDPDALSQSVIYMTAGKKRIGK